MKETFTVSVINTRTQSRSTLSSSAETLGQLKEELMNAGIDYSGMTFMEGSTKTELKDDSSILPTNVPVKKNGTATGETTNNLVFFLTAPEKHISSGAVSDRKEAYAFLKEHPSVAKEFAARFGKNYTNGATKDLVEFVNSRLGLARKAAKTECNKENAEQKKESVNAALVGYIDKLLENGYISREVADGLLSVINGGDAPEVKQGYSDSDIDAMYGDWMK